MVLTVGIEEACLHPDYVDELCTKYTGGKRGPLHELLCDIQKTRIAEMDKHGNEFQVLSLTTPGPQGEPDKGKVSSRSHAYQKMISVILIFERQRKWHVCAMTG